MAGAILVSENNGISLNSLDFYYIIEKIRSNFKCDENFVKDAIYNPIDEGGMSFISLKEQNDDHFNAFVRAALIAYEIELREQPLSSHRISWDALISALCSDSRIKKNCEN